MNTVCGILDRRGGEAKGLDAMLAALAGSGGAGARWEGDAAGLGCRGPGGAGSAPPSLRFDAEAGVTVAADARLDDRAAPPSRAGYVDMPRLLERLDAGRIRGSRRRAPVLRALELLDF